MPPPLAQLVVINHKDNQDEGDGSDGLDDQVTILGEPRRVKHGVVRGRGRGRAYQNVQRRAQQEASQIDHNIDQI